MLFVQNLSRGANPCGAGGGVRSGTDGGGYPYVGIIGVCELININLCTI